MGRETGAVDRVKDVLVARYKWLLEARDAGHLYPRSWNIPELRSFLAASVEVAMPPIGRTVCEVDLPGGS